MRGKGENGATKRPRPTSEELLFIWSSCSATRRDLRKKMSRNNAEASLQSYRRARSEIVARFFKLFQSSDDATDTHFQVGDNEHQE